MVAIFASIFAFAVLKLGFDYFDIRPTLAIAVLLGLAGVILMIVGRFYIKGSNDKSK